MTWVLAACLQLPEKSFPSYCINSGDCGALSDTDFPFSPTLLTSSQLDKHGKDFQKSYDSFAKGWGKTQNRGAAHLKIQLPPRSLRSLLLHEQRHCWGNLIGKPQQQSFLKERAIWASCWQSIHPRKILPVLVEVLARTTSLLFSSRFSPKVILSGWEGFGIDFSSISVADFVVRHESPASWNMVCALLFFPIITRFHGNVFPNWNAQLLPC